MGEPALLLAKKMIRSLFYLLNLTVFMLLLLPAVPLDVSLWWLDNLFNLQVQWALVALFLVLGNFIFIRKLRLLWVFLYSSIILYNLLPLYLAPNEEIKEEIISVSNQPQIIKQRITFTIAQLNLNYDNPNLQQLLPILGDKKIDLLVIQEASDKEYESFKQLARYYPYSFGINDTEATPSGMALFSRHPIVEKHLYDMGYKSGHVLEAILQMPGTISPIQVYELHPVSPRNEILWKRRNTTMATIADKIVASPFTNQIVIGDFNSSPWSSAFINFEKTTQLKNSALGFGYIPSWSYSTVSPFSMLSSAYIDHSLVSDSFKVINKYAQPIEGSDHQLLLTELEI